MKNVAPTKTNLIRIRDELKFARMGHDLLDQKRNILVLELLNLVDQAVEYESKVDAALAKAYVGLEDSVLAMGKIKVGALASAIDVKATIALKQRRVMGVALPVVQTSFEDHGPYYSPMDTSAAIDGAVAAFRDALGLLGRLAELKVSIVRLAREVRKTIRKVNALEKIAIPELDESLHYIQNRIEESERDMFVLMKMVKDRLSKPDPEVSLE
ncbi:MAG: V-type ATP synthase subunit D [Spirochaetae bacterium HGW-Spirochaetae-3]|jgi:V/A-type H+-transporting ATPase subunit D|nr:MAG: V-type ATP synthase subunit D [Spirochaetae bacterium HGW-Spirochaetae-3]